MLPQQIRNTAHAVADAFAGSGGALMPFVVSPEHSMFFIGIVMGTVTIVTAALTWMLPETRGMALGTAISRATSRGGSISGGSSRASSRRSSRSSKGGGDIKDSSPDLTQLSAGDDDATNEEAQLTAPGGVSKEEGEP